MADRPLTDKQARFVEEYLIDLNATQAAIRAGYSDPAYGRQLKAKAHIASAIDRGIGERRSAFEKRTVLHISPEIGEQLTERFGSMEKATEAIERVAMSLMDEDNLASIYAGRQRNFIGGDARYALLYKAGFKCQACGSKPSPHNDVTLAIDHIVPFSWGGSDDPDNLQVLCEACNCSKGDRFAYDHNAGQLRLPFE